MGDTSLAVSCLPNTSDWVCQECKAPTSLYPSHFLEIMFIVGTLGMRSCLLSTKSRLVYSLLMKQWVTWVQPSSAVMQSPMCATSTQAHLILFSQSVEGIGTNRNMMFMLLLNLIKPCVPGSEVSCLLLASLRE